MSRALDIVGKKYGKLTVIERLKGSKAKCKCDCGKETIVLVANLTRGHTTSCGCTKYTDITGQKYGDLTVINEIIIDKRIYCNCLCSCGKECMARKDLLTSGKQQSCGHIWQMSEEAKGRRWVDGTQPSKLSCKPTKSNKSGVVGVNWDKSRGKWQAGIRFKGHRYNLGRFEALEEAKKAREEAEKHIFGDFLEWYKKQNNKE